MRMKKEYIILAVVIVALAAYLVSRKQDRNLYDLPEIASVQAKEITRVELVRGKDTVTFHKEGSDWKISPGDYPADPLKIKDMLEVVEDLTLTVLISESKNYQRYDLDAKDGINLKCWANDKLKFELLIGKAAESFNHTFVKLPDNLSVYQGISGTNSTWKWATSVKKRCCHLTRKPLMYLTFRQGRVLVPLIKKQPRPRQTIPRRRTILLVRMRAVNQNGSML